MEESYELHQGLPPRVRTSQGFFNIILPSYDVRMANVFIWLLVLVALCRIYRERLTPDQLKEALYKQVRKEVGVVVVPMGLTHHGHRDVACSWMKMRRGFWYKRPGSSSQSMEGRSCRSARSLITGALSFEYTRRPESRVLMTVLLLSCRVQTAPAHHHQALQGRR